MLFLFDIVRYRSCYFELICEVESERLVVINLQENRILPEIAYFLRQWNARSRDRVEFHAVDLVLFLRNQRIVEVGKFSICLKGDFNLIQKIDPH